MHPSVQSTCRTSRQSLAHNGRVGGGQTGQGSCVRRLVVYPLIISNKVQVVAYSTSSQV